MNVLIDTSAWSLVLRKSCSLKKSEEIRKVVENLIQEYRVQIIGAIRQEILSGISEKNQFLKLRDVLGSFEDLRLDSSNYERAAEMFNICRKNGIQGSHTDFLICAAAEHYHTSILTLDNDFEQYAKYLPIRLFPLE